MKYLSFVNLKKSRALLAIFALVLSLPIALASAPTALAATLEAEATDAVQADPIRTCGTAPRDKDSSRWGKYFKVNGVNIRKAPSTRSTICAQGQKSHIVDYHCWTTGADGYTWTYLRDVTTHYAGWVRDSLLTNHGSLVHC